MKKLNATLAKFDEVFDDIVDLFSRSGRTAVVVTWFILAFLVGRQFVISFYTAYNEWTLKLAIIAMVMTILLAALMMFAVMWCTHWREKSLEHARKQHYRGPRPII